jgi:predicted acylesterase/phospholipase RssA/CRP-like cAMP-binding protein
VLSGIGVGATLPILGSAALAAVPGGRFATASAVVSSARQLGGAFGIAILVVIIGTPTATTTVDVLRDGWVFCAACFALTAVGALLLRNVTGVEEDAPTDARSLDVHVPPGGEDAVDGETLLPTGRLDLQTFLDRLPDDVRLRLVAAGTRIEVAAGDWVFRQGDSADVMYVVLSGRLDVVVDDVAVRELGPGAQLGELALLTGGRRSASVRARRDSALLALSRPAFMRAIETSPATAVAVATALAEALVTARPPEASTGGPAGVVAVVGLRAGDPAEAVGHALAAGVRRHCDVFLSTGLSAAGLAAAEAEHDRVLLVAAADEDGGGEWWRSCVRQSDRVVVVADSTSPPPSRWDGPAETDVVLVGPRPGDGELKAWAEAMRPWQITTVAKPTDAPANLVASLSGRSLGLVLAGGGARAMAHIGVIRELEDAGIVVHRVAGTSLGAIVAGAYALGLDGEELQARHHEAFVAANPFGDYTFPSKALTKGRRTPEMLRRFLGEHTRIESLPRLFRCVSTDLAARSSVVHRDGFLWEAAAASARLPILTPPLRMADRLHVDGCVLDNLPVGALLERDEGPLVAVNIGAGERAAAPGEIPRMPTLGDTLLRVMTIGGQGTAQRARDQGAFVITPPSLGVGVLEFHQLDRMVEAGRMAARALLDATGGNFAPDRHLVPLADHFRPTGVPPRVRIGPFTETTRA